MISEYLDETPESWNQRDFCQMPQVCTMENIVMAKKMENGIALYYGPVAERTFESFTYAELIDLGINASDLLENPQDYLLDPEKRRINTNKDCKGVT